MFNYIKYADLLKEIIVKKKQLKQVIYNQKSANKTSEASGNSPNVSAAYSLLSLITNNYAKFQQFVEKVQIKTKSTIKNPFLFIVMTAQYINMDKIKGGGKIKKIILQNIHLLPQIKKQTKINKQNVQIRLIEHKNVQSQNHDQDQINKTQNQDSFQKWKKIFDNQKCYKKIQLIKNMYHLSAQQYQKLISQHPTVLNSPSIVIQSFSSSLPPTLLLKGVQNCKLKGFRIIDACSAPGNKTIQLGQYCYAQNQKRKVLAFEKDPRRFQVLNNTIRKHNSYKNIKSYNQNFLETIPSQQRFNKVKFILLDPSCSGSGMLSNYLRDQTQQNKQMSQKSFQQFCDWQYQNLNQKQKQRVQNLHNFQIQLLNHTAKFNPKRISYSTCSIYKRQNQDIVKQFLQSHPQYSLKSFSQIKKNKGNFSIEQGFNGLNNCIRMDPRKRQTDGFFVAVFYKKSQK